MTRSFVSRAQVHNVAVQALGDLIQGRTEQAYNEVSTVQNYELGSKILVDERSFRYCLAGSALERNIGCFNFTQWPLNAALTVAAVVGSRTMSIPEATAAVNFYRGGWITIFTANLQFYRIIRSTVRYPSHNNSVMTSTMVHSCLPNPTTKAPTASNPNDLGPGESCRTAQRIARAIRPFISTPTLPSTCNWVEVAIAIGEAMTSTSITSNSR